MAWPSSPPRQHSPPRIHPLADIFPDSLPLTTVPSPALDHPPLGLDHPPLGLDHPSLGLDHTSPVLESAPSDKTSDVASDMPRLRATHCTAGYRDGISATKEQWLQPGFDEGYSLGAVLGLRVGYLLGVLEGLCAAVARGHMRGGEDGERLRKLLKDARAELALQNVFAREWWGEDGVWKFPVRAGATAAASGGERNYGEDEDEEEVTFVEVADQHPLLTRWSHAVRAEMQRAGVHETNIFDGDEWESGRI
ncbi:Essential protein Yae1, N terminal [Pseudocyphellaria aurata]|nr:Essential protein Yae1, N terminal [Pseudocyphellaria aurata]